jgi:hypothetical protein
VRAHPARRVLHIGGRLTPSLLLRATGARHGPRRLPCGLPHHRPLPPRGFSTASTLPRRSGTVQPPSPHLASAARHGDALGAHLIACTPLVSAHHPRHHAGRSCGDRALRGRRVPRPQLARPASGPHARPVAKTACLVGGPPCPALLLRVESRPKSRFPFSNTFLNYLINRNGSKL